MRDFFRLGWSCVLLAHPLIAGAAGGVTTGGGAISVNTGIHIAVRIPRVMRLRALDLPSTITLTSDDISRGEVVVKGRLDVLVNDPQGYLLGAQLTSRTFPGFRLEGLARVVETNGEPVAVSMPSMVGLKEIKPFPVEYRLHIAPDAVPGQYPWPVILTLHNP
jgi:hypothetical protein